MSENQQAETTDVEELNEDGAGAGATPDAPSSFEPEEPEHPADEK
ncbi:hypothetical protein [Luteococcus peritonei]|uniref:Nucleotide exchange factor GrpE n=1 Tax=Luteococcus peritonei TaxID=88874 RepID=A0ABW4RU27_9ACTN